MSQDERMAAQEHRAILYYSDSLKASYELQHLVAIVESVLSQNNDNEWLLVIKLTFKKT